MTHETEQALRDLLAAAAILEGLVPALRDVGADPMLLLRVQAERAELTASTTRILAIIEEECIRGDGSE